MLNIIKNTALVAVVGLGLGACSSMYDTAKNTAPAGDAYNKALFSELMALADFERKEEDWTDANYFGGMAVAAASGETVALTDPNARRLNRYKNSGYTREDVVAAHNAVSGVMADGGASRDPAAMAKAVAGYECMYEQIEEGHQAADIKRCKEMLDGALAALAVRPMMEPGVCYFPIGGDVVDFDCQKAISAIADAAANGGQVVVQGHADTLGTPEFNLELSKRRAQNVVEVLNQLGIPTDRMTVGAVGESQLRVETPDQTAEQQNRVVVMRVVN